jgi:hypothetical protein
MLAEICARPMAKIEFKSSQAFHRTPRGHELKNTVEDQFVLGNLKSFDPMTQELYQYFPATIHTQNWTTQMAENRQVTPARENHNERGPAATIQHKELGLRPALTGKENQALQQSRLVT